MEPDLTLYHGLDGTLEHGSSLILGNICIKIMHTYMLYSQIVHFFSGTFKLRKKFVCCEFNSVQAYTFQ